MSGAHMDKKAGLAGVSSRPLQRSSLRLQAVQRRKLELLGFGRWFITCTHSDFVRERLCVKGFP